MLEVEIEKDFQNKFKLDVKFSVKKDSYGILLGPSGAGKSLTLKFIAGFEKTIKGKVILDGKDMTNQVPEKRNIVYLPQNMGLFPNLTVIEHIYFPFKAKKLKVDKKEVNEIIEHFNIGHLLNRYPNELSGGEKQRIALARSLVAKPRLLLLDEPLTGLDFHLKMKLIRFLKTLKQSFNLTIIQVTHDPLEALYLGEQVFVIEHGKIIFSGSVKEFLKENNNGFILAIKKELMELKKIINLR